MASLYRSTGPQTRKPRKTVVTMALKPRTPGMSGPKPKPVDWGMVFKLAKIGCTPSEIAATMDMCEATLTSRPEFFDVFKKGSENGKSSLRRLQWKSAASGNAIMQIFLGKQKLGQADKFTTELTGSNGGIVEIATSRKPSLDKLDIEELSVLLALIDKAGGTSKKVKEGTE